ncbi:hypothetical protein A9B99_02445 [Mangrovibacter phragmitis]|uniref:histidine kinase n=1 Tax=Mangrovibacter phragmitis TaxID=1691903 RepID=A0A1B7L8A8_9ENTR|nr:ATP-binding protein [Mangrovibacter phragmitis]OAT78604.1 hypothetical protein A9B99_02445 [Mangrovibacter phragmitis]
MTRLFGTLSRRLAALFLLLLVSGGALLAGVQVSLTRNYGNAVVQQLSAGLAQHLVRQYPRLADEGMAGEQTRALFNNLMAVNPNVELYLIDPQGMIINDAAPPGHLKRQKVSVEPVTAFLHGDPFPVYGDDPRQLHGKKVFSAAPFITQGKVRGYVYVILQGEHYSALHAMAWQHNIGVMVAASLVLLLIMLLILGGATYHWVARPVRALERRVRQISLAQPRVTPAEEPDTRSMAQELVSLWQGVTLMEAKIASQWAELAQETQERRAFLATVSHDLRTPLTAIHGYIESILLLSDNLSDEEKRQYLEIALSESRKVSQMAQSLFELARLEYGVITPDKTPFSLEDLVQDVMQKMTLAAQTRNQRLQVEPLAGLPVVCADMGMIERVLTNLLDNAIRHTPERSTIAVRAWLSSENVTIEVADNGPGIPSEKRSQLFTRPALLKGESLSRGGLGLMVVHQILQLHGSRIELVPCPGACFRFTLPLATQSQPGALTAPEGA